MAIRLTRAGSAPFTLAVLFALITGLPLAALASLGWHVFDTEREQERERVVDQLDAAAGQVVREIERNLASWEELAAAVAGGRDAALPAGAVVFALDDDGVHWRAGRQISPLAPSSAHVPAHTFDIVDGLERRGDLVQAAAVSRSHNPRLCQPGDERSEREAPFIAPIVCS